MTVWPFAVGGKGIAARLAAVSLMLTNRLHRFRGATTPRVVPPDPAWRALSAHPDAELFEALNLVLRLSDSLPTGASGDRVRRCVCELIEAGTGADRDARLGLLVNSITDLQHTESVPRPAEGAVVPVIERLLNAVRSEVIPILQPGYTPGSLSTSPSLGTRAEAEEN